MAVVTQVVQVDNYETSSKIVAKRVRFKIIYKDRIKREMEKFCVYIYIQDSYIDRELENLADVASKRMIQSSPRVSVQDRGNFCKMARGC